MLAEQREVLGLIKFLDPDFEEAWIKNNSFDYELFRFAQKLSRQRVSNFWNLTNGELLPLVREPGSAINHSWTKKSLKSKNYC